MPRKRATDPKFIVKYQKQVAEFFKVHLSTVRFWFTDGCPHGHQHYDLREIAKWRLAKLKSEAPPDPAKVKLQKIKLRDSQIDLEQKESDHVPTFFVREIINGWCEAAQTIGERLSTDYDRRAEETMRVCARDMRRSLLMACQQWGLNPKLFGVEPDDGGDLRT